jgi:hypothetical protein
LVTLTCIAGLVAAQPAVDSVRDSLVVKGENFSFAVKEPAGWRGDTSAASTHHASIVFFPANELSQSDVTIRIRIEKKTDEHIAAALAADMDRYRKEYPDIRFGELMIDHPSYATYSKLCFVPRQFYDYVSYINAGKDVAYVFVVTMTVAKRPANGNERTALDAVARSLRVIDPHK